MIVKPIFCQNTAKTGLLESYDQEISGFLDRNPGRNVRVRSEESMRNLGRDVERVCVEWKLKENKQTNKQTTDRQEADKRQADKRQAEIDRQK